MKLHELFEQAPPLTPEQIEWLNKRVKLKRRGWKYNTETGLVDTTCNVELKEEDTSILVPFGHVGGDFRCGNTNITSQTSIQARP